MALHERIALQAGSIGIRAELNAVEVYAEHASRLLKLFFQQGRELLAKDQLQPESNPEGMDRTQFPDVPLALPPSQLPCETSCKADHKRPSVREVFLRWPVISASLSHGALRPSRMLKNPSGLSFRGVRQPTGDEESRKSVASRARFLASPWTVRSRASLGMTTFTKVFQHPVRRMM
jgi:hypothetical protein